MCGFTLVRHTECGHKYASTTPEHTRLCGWATIRHLQQGIDCAPAPCVFSSDTDTCIIATYELEIDPRGEDEGALQKHAHVKEDAVGVYGQMEDEELQNLRDYIEEREKRGIELQREFDAYVDTQPGGVPHPHLRVFFSQLQPAGYQGLYLNKLQTCLDWFAVLEKLKEQEAPSKLFADTVLWVFSQAEKVSLILDRLGDVLDCLRQFEPSRLKRTKQTEQPSETTNIDFNGSETQLDYLVYFLILQHRGSGPELPGPNFQYIHPAIRLSFNTLLTFRIREAVNRIQCSKPTPRSIQKYKRYEAGTMNIRKLRFELVEGLLEEEPASQMQCEHVKMPHVGHAKRIDVEDEHGNKLVWSADGTISKLIFAGSRPEPIQSSEQVQDQPKAGYGGYGFAYSGSDSDSDLEDCAVLERPTLSIAGGNLDAEVDRTDLPGNTAVGNGDSSSPHIFSDDPQQHERAPLSYVDPNRKRKTLRARRPKGDVSSSLVDMQIPPVAQEDIAKETATPDKTETGTKRKYQARQNSNGRTGGFGFGFAEESSALDSSSPLPSLSGPASPAPPSSPPPYEPAG